MSPMNSNQHEFLSKAQATTQTVDQEWDQGNQQWWDWYVSLAENDPSFEFQPLLKLPEPTILPKISPRELNDQLSQTFHLSDQHIENFQQNGYVKLKNVLTPEALSQLRHEMIRLFQMAGEKIGAKFGSLEMMWQGSPTLHSFVFSRRLARIATELLGVTSVRLYHDNGLSKEPGCGRTPWHYDDHHFPIASNNVCTVWVPLQAIPIEMGPLCFAKGMNVYKLVQEVPFNKFDTSYDRTIIQILRKNMIEIDDSPFELGEVSFHHNLNFHSAGPNLTNISRMVLATTYFENGARVIDTPHMVNGDWRKFMPGVEPSQTINTPLNPVLYTSDKVPDQ